MKLKSFTLIELMVTLTIFSVAMLTITGILTLGMKNLEAISKGSYSQIPVVIYSKVLENILVNSYDVALNTNGNYEISSFNEKKYELVTGDHELKIIEYYKDKKPITKVFKIERLVSSEFKFIEAGGRKGLDLRITLKGSLFEKYFLLGYKRKEAEL